MRVEADSELYANNFGLVRTSSTTLHLQFKGKLDQFLDKNYFLPLCDEIFNVMFKCKLFIRPTTKSSTVYDVLSSALSFLIAPMCFALVLQCSFPGSDTEFLLLGQTDKSKKNLGVSFPM